MAVLIRNRQIVSESPSSPDVSPAAGEVLRVYHLDRGYERLEEKLSAVGATIERRSAG